MRRKKVSRRTALRQCFAGKRAKTNGSNTKNDLMVNKHGKVVSKKMYKRGASSKWMQSVVKARKALHIKGFQVVGGKSAKGQALLKKARSLYK